MILLHLILLCLNSLIQKGNFNAVPGKVSKNLKNKQKNQMVTRLKTLINYAWNTMCAKAREQNVNALAKFRVTLTVKFCCTVRNED